MIPAHGIRRFRLAVLGASPCEGCTANCCKQNGHDYAVLLRDDEYARFGPFGVDVAIDRDGRRIIERVLPYLNGRCQFLGQDDRCTIYEDRPLNCRLFECAPGYHLGGGNVDEHSRFLQLNPDIIKRLEQF